MKSTFFLLIVILALTSTPVESAEQKPDELNKTVVKRALSEYREKDAFAAVEYVCAQSDPTLAVASLLELMRHSYWKQKDLAAALVFGRAGHQHAMAMAAMLENEQPEKAMALRAVAKGFTYDIASFTWPGWDEKEIKINGLHIEEGLSAARANLRLAKQLKKGELPMSRAYWMLGAHELANGNNGLACEAFAAAAEHAKEAESPGEELLARSFECLVEVLASNGNKAASKCLMSLLVELRKVKDGEFFAG